MVWVADTSNSNKAVRLRWVSSNKSAGLVLGRHFNFFLGEAKFFFFFNATGLLKNWKNSTLYVVIWRHSYIVPFFLFLFFFLFFSLFFFLFFFHFFSFSLGASRPPPQWRLLFSGRYILSHKHKLEHRVLLAVAAIWIQNVQVSRQ